MRRAVWLWLAFLVACTRAGIGGGWGTAHEMTIARANDPSSLNPLIALDEADVDLTQLYAEPLVGLNAENQPIPLVAERVPTVANGDLARDGTTLTYHLRHGVRFADGTPLTSKDVIFTYRAILDKRNPTTETQPYREIVRFDAPNPYTVVLHFRRPWAAAPSALFAVTDYIYGILPAHGFTSTDVSHAAWNDRPYGSGPFRVVSWKRGDEIVLEPNPYAWRKPHLHRLTFKIAPDRNTQLLLFQTHAVDAVDILTTDQAQQSRSTLGRSLVQTNKNHLAYALFNTQRFPTDDLRVRRALVEAVNTPDMSRKVYHGAWPVATTEIPPVIWAHDPAVRAYAYDPAAAARFLAERHLTVDIAFEASSAEGRAVATIIQQYLSRVGVQAAVRGYPTTVFYDVPNGTYYGGRFNLAVTGYYGGMDPEQSEWFTCDRLAPNGPNATRFCDPAYDRLFLEQSRLTDRRGRQAAFSAMQRIVTSSALFIPLVYNGGYSAINPALRGWAPNMLYEYSNSNDWDVVP